MKPVVIIAIAIGLGSVVAVGVFVGINSVALMSPEQRIQQYETKKDYLLHLETQIYNLPWQNYLDDLSVNQDYICANKENIIEIVACIDNPELTKKAQDLLDKYEKTRLEIQAMELGS